MKTKSLLDQEANVFKYCNEQHEAEDNDKHQQDFNGHILLSLPFKVGGHHFERAVVQIGKTGFQMLDLVCELFLVHHKIEHQPKNDED